MSNQLVNLSYLIESSLEDEDYIKMMIEMYLKNTPNYLNQLDELYAAYKLDELQKLAHKFKASVSIMGVTAAVNDLQTLETNIAAKENLDQCGQLLTNIRKQCTESLSYLQGLLDAGKPFCA